MLRLRQALADQRSFLDEFLPPELRDLPEDLAKLDRWLNNERFFQPFLGHYHRWLGRPSIPAEIAAKTIEAAKGVLDEAKQSGDAAVKRAVGRLMSVEEHVGRVVEQSRQVNSGNLHIPDRLVSIFDPDARPIQRGSDKT